MTDLYFKCSIYNSHNTEAAETRLMGGEEDTYDCGNDGKVAGAREPCHVIAANVSCSANRNLTIQTCILSSPPLAGLRWHCTPLRCHAFAHSPILCCYDYLLSSLSSSLALLTAQTPNRSK